MRGRLSESLSALRIWQRGEKMATTAREPEVSMINGAHVVIYSKDAEVDRAFFRDVLQFPFVDAGHGWLIFAMPPFEVAFHDAGKHDSQKGASESGASESADKHELFLMCDDIAATLKDLQAKNVKVSEVSEQRWGKLASFTLPGGGKIGIYEPKHPSPWKR
jgi:catechol 2,3-dioxygenase-like lactoylglutathione lyase family enzyme